MTRILVIFLIFVQLALPLRAASAAANPTPAAFQQGTIAVEDLGVIYEFGTQLTFNARIPSDREISKVMLFVTPSGETAVMRDVPLDSDGEVHYTFRAADLGLRPFSQNQFHFLVELKGGEILSSTPFTFRYEDNRFEWNSLVETDFEVYWYGRDAAFGQELLAVAREGLGSATEILAVDPPAPIRIYAYDSSKDLQSALNLNRPWIVGHAAPDLGQMYLYIPHGAEQRLEMERQVPHEIMHFLQYRVAEENLRRQPVWLMEGMASLAELYPNPEYQRHLRTAADRRELLSMSSLCKSFPRETFGAYLAYAQSASFVRLLYQNYGSDGLKKLMEQYNGGLGCEEGPTAALGASLGQFEYRWKQETLGMDAGNLVLRNLSPYLLLLLLLLVPAALVLVPAGRANQRNAKEQQAPQEP